jgi:hypothetical protein
MPSILNAKTQRPEENHALASLPAFAFGWEFLAGNLLSFRPFVCPWRRCALVSLR